MNDINDNDSAWQTSLINADWSTSSEIHRVDQ